MGLIRAFSYHVRPALQAGTLREVLSDFVPASVPVHMVHGTQDMVPLKVRAFIDFCVPRLQTRLTL